MKLIFPELSVPKEGTSEHELMLAYAGRVARGCELLDAIGPADWWASFDMERFDMGECCYSAAGQYVDRVLGCGDSDDWVGILSELYLRGDHIDFRWKPGETTLNSLYYPRNHRPRIYGQRFGFDVDREIVDEVAADLLPNVEHWQLLECAWLLELERRSLR